MEQNNARYKKSKIPTRIPTKIDNEPQERREVLPNNIKKRKSVRMVNITVKRKSVKLSIRKLALKHIADENTDDQTIARKQRFDRFDYLGQISLLKANLKKAKEQVLAIETKASNYDLIEEQVMQSERRYEQCEHENLQLKTKLTTIKEQRTVLYKKLEKLKAEYEILKIENQNLVKLVEKCCETEKSLNQVRDKVTLLDHCLQEHKLWILTPRI